MFQVFNSTLVVNGEAWGGNHEFTTPSFSWIEILV